MKNLAKIISLCVATLCANLSADDQPIICLTSADNPPYEFVKSGDVVGFDIDLGKAIAKEIGRNIVFKDISFAGLVPALIAGHGDCVIASISPTQSKRENMDFSIPYFESQSAIVLLKNDKFDNVSDEAIFPILILSGKTVGVQLGTHHETDLVNASIEDLSIRRYDYVTSMVAEMHKSANGVGSLYGIVVGVPEANSIVAKNKNLIFYRMSFSDSCAVAFPKKSTLVDQFNDAINRLKANGTIKSLELKWGVGE